MLKSSGYLAENAPQLAAERMQEAMKDLAVQHGTEVQTAEVKEETKETDASKKRITQETFDEVVQENIEDFEMEADEAVADAIAQFKTQNVDLGNVVCRAPGAACPLTDAIVWVGGVLPEEAGGSLDKLTGTPADEWVAQMAFIEKECKLTEENKLVARKVGACWRGSAVCVCVSMCTTDER